MGLNVDLCIIGDGGSGRQIALAAAALGARCILISDSGANRRALTGLTADVVDGALGLLLAHAQGAASRRTISPAALAQQAQDTLAGLSLRVLRARGVACLSGQTRFTGSKTVTCGAETITARRFVIAAQAEPVIPDGLVPDTVPFLTPETFFGLASVPERLVIVGGSALAVEFAQAVAALSGHCSLLHDGPILPGYGAEAVALVRRGLIRRGVALHEHTRLVALKTLTAGLTLDATGPAGPLMLNAGQLLLVPDYAALPATALLAGAGVSVGGTGVALDSRLRTSNRAIYVAGQRAMGGLTDPAAGLQVAHILRSVLVGLAGPFDGGRAPRRVRTTPGIVELGLDEAAARAGAPGVRVYRAPLAAPAPGTAPSDGFLKLAADKRGRILGAALAGPVLEEITGVVALAMANGLALQQIASLALPPGDRAGALREIAVTDLARRLQTPMARRVSRLLRLFS